MTRRVVQTINHPAYNGQTLVNDISLLRLESGGMGYAPMANIDVGSVLGTSQHLDRATVCLVSRSTPQAVQIAVGLLPRAAINQTRAVPCR